jgi:hypothetical protein
VIDRKSRSRVYNSIDADNFERSFVVPNLLQKEMWACYPTSGNSLPNEALVWNWEENSISFRDLPNIAHAGYGVVNPGASSTWDLDTGTWDSDPSVWDAQTFNPTQTRLMFAGTNDTKIYLGDDPETNTENGTAMNSYVERTGLFNETSSQVKYCRGLYPKMSASGPVNIYVGSQMSLDEAVSWEGPFPFNPATDYKIDCEVSFRWMGVKYESTTDVDWSLTGYELDIEDLGRN